MPRTFKITFPNGHAATAASVQDTAELVEAVSEMGLNQRRPTMVLVGGASGLRPIDLDRLRPIFSDTLVPLVQQMGATVIDGGTDAGVMGLIGKARNEARAGFSLVGLAPASLVAVPDQSSRAAGTLEVEPHHTHFLFVPGTRWGDESRWMSSTVEAISGGGPSVTVLVDGGETAWKDVAESVRAGRPVIVVDGSGRVADTLSAALVGKTSEARALKLAKSGLLHAIHLHQGSAALATVTRSMLSGK